MLQFSCLMRHSAQVFMCWTLFWSSGLVCGGSVRKPVPKRQPVDYQLDIHMKGRQPGQDEEYVCTSIQVPAPAYATGFNPTANMDRVHHMLLFACSKPFKVGGFWDCSYNYLCSSQAAILYAWARNAPALKLPEDVGAPVGFDGSQFLVLQVHYAKKFQGDVFDYSGVSLDIVTQQPSFLSAVYLFVTNGPPVPPKTETHFMNMSCVYNGSIELHEQMQHVHVADRENGRLQCLFFNGTPAFDVKLPTDFLTVYSVDYNENTNTFFMMPGEKSMKAPGAIKAFSASPVTHLPLYSWAPKTGDFVQPHVIRVSKDGSIAFVGEVGGNGGVLWKFQISQSKRKTATATEQTDKNKQTDAQPVNKPGESIGEMGDTNKGSSVFFVLIIAVVVPALLIALVCACLRFRKQGGFRATNMLSQSSFRDSSFRKNGFNGAFRSHKGFQPLRTEDIDAVDDLTDESENEDTLFAASQGRGIPLQT